MYFFIIEIRLTLSNSVVPILQFLFDVRNLHVIPTFQDVGVLVNKDDPTDFIPVKGSEICVARHGLEKYLETIYSTWVIRFKVP